MNRFTSTREKKLWLWALTVTMTIFSTLFIGQPLIKLFRSQDVRAIIFVGGMILVGSAILIHALKTKPAKLELAIWLGLTAVYMMFILRLGMPERSHLFEYSVLAIFIHKALIERASHGIQIPWLPLLSFVLTFMIGVIDEGIQIFLPDRVFDPADILFNGFAVAMAIGSNVLLNWIRKRWRNTS